MAGNRFSGAAPQGNKVEAIVGSPSNAQVDPPSEWGLDIHVSVVVQILTKTYGEPMKRRQRESKWRWIWRGGSLPRMRPGDVPSCGAGRKGTARAARWSAADEHQTNVVAIIRMNT